jgi:hypothetical protein
MSTGRMIELVVAVAFLVAGIWLYRRNKAVDGGYGSQGAVLLFVVGIIAGIHALGLMEYRPSTSELEAMQTRSR